MAMNLVFDLGGVVFDWQPLLLIDEIFSAPEDRSTAREGLLRHPDWLELDRGTLDIDEAARRTARRTGLPPERVAELLRRIPDHLVEREDTLELMRRLKEGGHRLYCLSNMHTHTIEALEERCSFWDLFDGIVISCRLKLIKPEPGIYRHLLESEGLEPSRTVFIDDMPENIEAAAQLGIGTVLFEDAAQCERELFPLSRE